MLLMDRQIMDLCCDVERPMIKPFHPDQITQIEDQTLVAQGKFHTTVKSISRGLSSVGYDISIGSKIKHFRPQNHIGDQLVIDPKNFDPALLLEHTVEQEIAPDNYFILPGRGYCLANTPEYFRMPEDVAAVCLTKSTYARCGLLVNVTPLEPEWEGHLTLELANLTDLPMKIYVYEGIAQLLFFKLQHRPEVTYADRGGKYQGQGNEPVAPRMK